MIFDRKDSTHDWQWFASLVIRLVKAALLCIVGYSACFAEQHSTFPDFDVHGLLDLRYQLSEASPGEIMQGLGKFRYGDSGANLRFNEAVAVLKTRWNWDWSSTLTFKYADAQYQPLDLTEAYFSYRPVTTSEWRLSSRIGMFFPPMSLENTGIGWTSPYTLSSSTINSWVGAELRSFGAELQASYQFQSRDRMGAFAAGIANNDATGVLLAWRGWGLHDYEATLQDQLRLPVGIGIAAFFPQQAELSQPFVEVDGRPGYYAGLNAERADAYTLRILYYDNMADPAAIKKGQYAWHTRFLNVGMKLELPEDLTLITQGISGRTTMGEIKDGIRAVDVGFWSASMLLSKSFGKQRISFRPEWFATAENDYLSQDRNAETGYALTANYNVTLAQRNQINLEISYIDSSRPQRISLDQPPTQQEILWQIAYRLFF